MNRKILVNSSRWKHAGKYFVSFLAVFNVIFSIVAAEDFQGIYELAGRCGRSPLNAVGKYAASYLLVSKPWPLNMVLEWVNKQPWYAWSIKNDLFLVFALSVIAFTLLLVLGKLIKTLLEIKREKRENYDFFKELIHWGGGTQGRLPKDESRQAERSLEFAEVLSASICFFSF